MSREMKDSGIAWIGKVPTNWTICKVKNGFTRKNSKAMIENPVVLSLARAGVKVRDLSNNDGQVAESYYNYNPVTIDDLLLNPMDLYSGANCSISKVEGVISPAYINLRYKKGYNPKFYDYYFKTQYWAMAMFAHGKGVSFDNRWTMNAETLMNYYIPCPNIEEQQKIANFLDEKVSEIDKVIAKTKESIEEDKKLKQAIITSIVTRGLSKKGGLKVSGLEWVDLIPSDWSIQKTSRYFKLSKGLPITKDNLKESGIPVVSYGQIHAKWNSGTRMHEELKRYVDISYANDYPQCKVPIGSIIMADTSEDLDGCGNAAYNDICDNLYAGYHTITLTSSEENNKYYSYLFKTSAWRSQIRQRASGVKLFSVTQKILKETTILVPPIETQIEISNYLDEKCNNIDSIILAKESICKELEQYKKSLIYEYVTGKKEVR